MHLKTRFILILFFIAIGAGTGYAWRSDIFAPSLESENLSEAVKKVRAIKPDNFKSKLLDVVPGPEVKNDFTFFDTLTDVSQNRFIDLDGNIIQMEGYEQESLVNELEVEAGKSILGPEEPVIALPESEPVQVVQKKTESSLEEKIRALEALVDDSGETRSDQTGSGESSNERAVVNESTVTSSGDPRFQVQVSSFREVERARAFKEELQNKGYPAFYTQVALPGKGVWYRVFLGEFERRGAAEDAARLARMRDSLQTMILTLQ
ncbi:MULTISPECIES: SPOR domain-containing protein [unclassified Nitrospina]|uniref:SPOR domain-containing protein n=1 Tax=unclassified Nitrospina TaxID=2638683 RepID=UPI003F9894E8